MPKAILIDDFDINGERYADDLAGETIIAFADLGERIEMLRFSKANEEKKRFYKSCIAVLSQELCGEMPLKEFERFQFKLFEEMRKKYV